MTRLINGLLIFSCLLLASCNFPDNAEQTKRTSNSNNQLKRNTGSDATITPPIPWADARAVVIRAKDKFSAKNSSGATPALVKDVVLETNNALSKLGKESDIDSCARCGEDAQRKTREAFSFLTGVTTKLKDKGSQKLGDLDAAVALQVQDDLVKASQSLKDANDSYVTYSKQAVAASDANNPQDGQNDGGAGSSGWTDWIWPVAGVVAGLGLVVLAIFGILRLRSGFWMKLDGHVNEIVSGHVGGVTKRHDEMAKHLSAIGEDQKKASSRLESIEGEIQALGRRLRQGGVDSSGYQGASVRQAFDEFARPPLPPVEPEFPASADEYLNKMKRNSLVVRPDFQNGILVNDIDGKGELVLIRDSSIPDDAQPLFLVPRVTQFQTKQQFLSYYERYYDCQKPSAGDVWIIDPAIVSTVPGGWELREKGVLEVR